MLGPNTHGHGRKPSMASSFDGSIEGTEPDVLPTSAHSDTTTVAGSAMSPKAKKGKKEKKEKEEEEEPKDSRPPHVDPSLDTTDPTPFAFAPLKLASLVDPKNLALLRELGGIEGLIKGVGSHRTRGLSARALGTAAGGEEEKEGEGAAYTGTIDDRRRVYGTNIIPVRKAKSLLLLMWLALQDKVSCSPECRCCYLTRARFLSKFRYSS
jgi:Ca2+-transporting ATPase